MNFDEFINTLSDTNIALDSITDFQKVIKNVSKLELKLNQLNYLIGKKNLKEAIKEIFEENPKSFEILNILVAIRNSNIKVIDKNGKINKLSDYFQSPEQIYEYIKETGLEEIFKNKNIKNLVDYVFGIEVGLDSNSRKNRYGKIMSKMVENLLIQNKIKYKKEVPSNSLKEIKNLGRDIKKFDFLIKTNKKTYLIEINFYNVGGSKLNEITRSYIEISRKLKSYKNYEFVWITDGKGWLRAKNKIQEAFEYIEKIYNLNTLSKFIQLLKMELWKWK